MTVSLNKIGLLVITAALVSACGGNSNDSPIPSATPVPSAQPTPTPDIAAIGLNTSVLDEHHRFDAPAAMVGISTAASTSITGALDYTITITNLTNAQPMSPALVVLHGGQYRSFRDGEEASLAIESMAEGGDTSMLISDAMLAPDYIAHQSSDGPIAPKSRQQLNFTVAEEDRANVHLTVLSMLVNTNDGFTGLNAVNIRELNGGGEALKYAAVWDAGTEANSEAAGSIPGPADEGEGFNAARSDSLNKVRRHAGVITNALASGITSN